MLILSLEQPQNCSIPYGQVVQPGQELEGLGLCQGLLRLALQPFGLQAGHGCASGLLQGVGISGQLPGFFPEGLAAIAGGGAVHGGEFNGILVKACENVIEGR